MTVTLHKISIHSKVDNYFDFTFLVIKAMSKNLKDFKNRKFPTEI